MVIHSNGSEVCGCRSSPELRREYLRENRAGRGRWPLRVGRWPIFRFDTLRFQKAQRRLAFAILIHSLSPGAIATGFALDARTTSMNISLAWLTRPCFRSKRP